MKASFWLVAVVSFWALLALAVPRAAKADPTVYVTFWFDTEDFILPQADDAAKRLAEMFTERGVQGTFKIVGEKAKVLEERGRDDVILALSKNDIAYHSTYHSVHPTPSEYCRDLGWQEGVSEFSRREGVGLETVRRIFGVNGSCYGQPGGSWTPQSYAALRELRDSAVSGRDLARQPERPPLLVLRRAQHPRVGRLRHAHRLVGRRGETSLCEIRPRLPEAGPRRRRDHQHLLSPLRVRAPAVLGRGQFLARRQSAPVGVETAAHEISPGAGTGLQSLRGLPRLHRPSSRRASGDGPGNPLSVSRPSLFQSPDPKRRSAIAEAFGKRLSYVDLGTRIVSAGEGLLALSQFVARSEGQSRPIRSSWNSPTVRRPPRSDSRGKARSAGTQFAKPHRS